MNVVKMLAEAVLAGLVLWLAWIIAAAFFESVDWLFGDGEGEGC